MNYLDPEVVTGFLLLLAVFLTLSLLKKTDHKIAFFLGLSLAAMVLVKQITVLSALSLGLVVLFKLVKGKKSISLSLFFAGGLILFLPLVLYFWQKGALNDWFFWNIKHYTAGIYPYASLGRETKDVLSFFVINLPLAAAALWFIRSRSFNLRLQAAVCFFPLFAFAISFWFATFHPQHFLTILPLASFSFGWVLQRWSENLRIKNLKILAVAVLILLVGSQVFWLVKMILPNNIEKLKQGKKVFIYNQHLPGSPEYEIAQWFKENTPEDTKILVFGDAMLYFDAQRLPANNRVYALPWLYRPLPEFEKLLQEKPPAYWLVDERLFERFEQLGDPEMAEFIKNHLDEFYPKETARQDYWVIREKV